MFKLLIKLFKINAPNFQSLKASFIMKYISIAESCDSSGVTGGNSAGDGNKTTQHRNNNSRRFRSNNGNNRSRNANSNNNNRQSKPSQPQHRQGVSSNSMTQRLPAKAMQQFYPLQWWETQCPAPLGALVFAAAAVATGSSSNGNANLKQKDEVNSGVNGNRQWIEHQTRTRPTSGDGKSLLWAKTQVNQVNSHGGDSHGSSSSSSSSASSQSIDSLSSFSPPLSSSSSVSSSPSPPALYDPHHHAHAHHHLVGVNGHHHRIDGQDMINESNDLPFFVDVDGDDEDEEEVEFGDMLVSTTTTPTTKSTTATITPMHRAKQQLSDEVDEDEDEEEELVLLQNLPPPTRPAASVGCGGSSDNSDNVVAPHSLTTKTSARAIKTVALYHRNEDIDNVTDATEAVLLNDHIDGNDFERTMPSSVGDTDEDSEKDTENDVGRDTKKVVVPRQTITQSPSITEELSTSTVVFHQRHHHQNQQHPQAKADSILSATRMPTVQQPQLLQANLPRTSSNGLIINGNGVVTASNVGGGSSSHSKEMQRKQWLDGYLSDLILKAYTHRRQERNLLTHKCHMQEAITTCLAAHFGPGMYFKIFLIGSSLTNIGSRRSDIDLCMVIYDERGRVDERYNNRLVAEAMLTRISNILEQTGLAFGSKVIRANVPIVKFYDGHGVEVNLNLNKLVTIQNSLLLVYYCSLDARVAPFMFIVKLWAQKNGINCAYFKSLSSYSLSLMAIFYLSAVCKPSVLPSFDEVAFFGQLLNQKLFNFYQPLAAGLELIAKHLHVTSSHPLLASPSAPLSGGSISQQQLLRTPHYYVPMFRIAKLSKDGADASSMMLLNNNHGGETRPFEVDQIISKVTFLTAEQANQRQQHHAKQTNTSQTDNKEVGNKIEYTFQKARGITRVQQQQQQHSKSCDSSKKGLLNVPYYHYQQQQQQHPFYFVNVSPKNVSDKLYCDRTTKSELFGSSSSLSNGQLVILNNTRCFLCHINHFCYNFNSTNRNNNQRSNRNS